MTLRRRDVVASLAVGVGVAATRAAAADGPVAPSAMHGQAEVFAGLKGATLEKRWKVSEVHHSNADRSVSVQVKDGAREFRLEVLKRDKLGVAGIGESRSLSVYVVNHGDGKTQTDESEGLAARALAAWLDEYEKSGKPVPELVTLAAHAKQGSKRSNEL